MFLGLSTMPSFDSHPRCLIPEQKASHAPVISDGTSHGMLGWLADYDRGRVSKPGEWNERTLWADLSDDFTG